MDGERLADLVAERARQNPKIAKVVLEARLFDELREHPAWQALKEHVLEQEENWMRKFAKRLMRPNETVSQREIDYHQGFFAGAKMSVLIPEVALANLKRVAETAWALGLDEETNDEALYPYQ